MTILFVGTVSGANVYFYANYGAELPWSAFSHAVLFGLLTVGGIMGLKAVFDLVMNDKMEMWLLDRRMKLYFERKQRDAQHRAKIAETMRMQQPPQYQNQFEQQSDSVSNEFLAAIEQ